MRSEAFACETSLCVASVHARLLGLPLIHYILCLGTSAVHGASFGFGLHESVAGVCVRECMRASVCVCARVCVRGRACVRSCVR